MEDNRDIGQAAHQFQQGHWLSDRDIHKAVRWWLLMNVVLESHGDAPTSKIKTSAVVRWMELPLTETQGTAATTTGRGALDRDR
jgi:hypothetical protein